MMTQIKRTTHGGAIIGQIDNHQIESYLGIPYAKPPIGEHRFKHAQLLTHWEQAIEALHFKHIPPQPKNKLEAFFSTHPMNENVPSIEIQDEDCLYLNIWKPAKLSENKPLPVMIWFYGGGFINGHGSAELYHPKRFAQKEQVIVITFNYRLGAIGYLNWHALNVNYDMNCGLSDQLCVLEWVNRFIFDFDGDPNNVTLCGQSAGAMSIMALMQLKAAQSLFHKVVLMSGVLPWDTIKSSTQTAHHFQQLAKQRYDQPIHNLTTAQIMQVTEDDITARGSSKGLELIYRPIFDASTMDTKAPAHWKVLMGYTKDEGYSYIRHESRKLTKESFLSAMDYHGIKVDLNRFNIDTGQGQADAVTNYIFKQPTLSWITQYENNSKWLYQFNWYHKTAEPFHHAYHILDVLFWLDHLDIIQAHGYPLDTDTLNLAQAMQDTLGRFIREGHPGFKVFNHHPNTIKQFGTH